MKRCKITAVLLSGMLLLANCVTVPAFAEDAPAVYAAAEEAQPDPSEEVPAATETDVADTDPSETGADPTEDSTDPAETGADPTEDSTDPAETGADPTSTDPEDATADPTEESDPSETGTDETSTDPSEESTVPSETESTTEESLPAETYTIPLQPEPDHSENGLNVDADGNAWFLYQGERLTGFFYTIPEYVRGDVTGDGLINASDAALILKTAARSAANGESAGAIIAAEKNIAENEYEAYQIADVSEDGAINASDAALLLNYAARYGSGGDVQPFGLTMYYADEDGYLRPGWIQYAGASYHVGAKYSLDRGWTSIKGKRYYFDTLGRMQTGKLVLGNNHYYLNEDGVMQTGWMELEDGLCWFDSNGVQAFGIRQINRSLYYFDEDGILQKGGWNKLPSGGLCYATDKTGALLKGWQTIDGKKYYLKDGITLLGWATLDDEKYYFDTSGVMQTGVVEIGGNKYRFGNDGVFDPIIICLDAGHYAKANHSPINPEYWESDFSWKFHLYLKTELESYGIEVITTRREKDKDRGLESRGKASEGCDLFLSLHSNACGDPSIDGPMALCQVNGSTDVLGQRLADTVAEVMQTKDGGTIWKRLGDYSTPKDYYGVLRGAASVGTPGILLEHSYHTNLRATKWLLNDNNLKKMAAAEAKTISDYFFESM